MRVELGGLWIRPSTRTLVPEEVHLAVECTVDNWVKAHAGVIVENCASELTSAVTGASATTGEDEPHRMTPVAVCPESPGSDRVIFMQDMPHRRVPPKPGEAHSRINLEGTVKVGTDEISRADAFQARVNAAGLITTNQLREEAQGS